MPISMQKILVQHDKVHSIICNKKVKQVNNIFVQKHFIRNLNFFVSIKFDWLHIDSRCHIFNAFKFAQKNKTR